MEIISFIEGLSKNFSFIRWVKGNADIREAEKWDTWVNECPTNLKLAKEAQKKVLGIDFTNSCSSHCDAEKEWNQLVSRIKFNKEKDTSTKTAILGRKSLLLFTKLFWISAVAGIAFLSINVNLSGEQKQENNFLWKLRETGLRYDNPAHLLTYLPIKPNEREQRSTISSNSNGHVVKMVEKRSGKSSFKKNISYLDIDFNITKYYLPTAFKKSVSQDDLLEKKTIYNNVFWYEKKSILDSSPISYRVLEKRDVWNRSASHI
ncbi:hypothetical protein NC796_15410 [Aliifodinibius sp. S!AR15-10]|uniref:hypothetical protein n=1 Tax=Aliifodinibius sp. S!AR15-10 TaxID=2950437 RepID=UPI00285B2CCF|nr:hypothetical protein [Aliifodinibius sp. S!AR15-10]MDR8392542.1 hypothetical protein [Aliifodinibius sp. S!AR15-10]